MRLDYAGETENNIEQNYKHWHIGNTIDYGNDCGGVELHLFSRILQKMPYYASVL